MGVVLGVGNDLLAEGAATALSAQWLVPFKPGDPDERPVGGLDLIGAASGLPRYPAESQADYLTRLLRRWTLWTQGPKVTLAEELASAGFVGVTIEVPNDFSPRPAPASYWSRFWVRFPVGSHPVTGPGGFVVGVGIVGTDRIGPAGFDTAEGALQFGLIRQIIARMKPSQWVPWDFIFELPGGDEIRLQGHRRLRDPSFEPVTSDAWDFQSASSDRIGFGPVLAFPTTQPFAVSMWVERSVLTAPVTSIIGNLEASPGFQGWEVQFASNPLTGVPAGGRASLIRSSSVSGNNWLNIQSEPIIPIGALTHVLIASDGTGTAAGVSFWQNGVPIGKVPAISDTLSGSSTSSADLTLGARLPLSQAYDGRARPVAIFDYVPTNGEAAILFNAGVDGDLNATPGLDPPVLWVKLDANDAGGAGGVIDYGSGGNDGTAAGGLPH